MGDGGWYIHLHAGTLQVGLPGSGSAYDKRHMNYGMRARGGIIYLYDDSMTFMQRDDVSYSKRYCMQIEAFLLDYSTRPNFNFWISVAPFKS